MEKTRKFSLVSMSRQKTLPDLFLVFLGQLKHDQKRFICITSLSFPKIGPLGIFSQFLMVTMETVTAQKVQLQFLLYM